MRTFHIQVINEHFSSTNEHKCGDVSAAWKEAIGGALAIAAEQVSHGNPFFGAEIVLTEGKQRIGRYVVSVGASPLKD